MKRCPNVTVSRLTKRCQYMVDYNWAESERERKRVIELNPNYRQAHQWNGARPMMNGKFDEARASLRGHLSLTRHRPE